MLAGWDLVGSFLAAALAFLVAYGLARLVLGILGLIASSGAEGWRRADIEVRAWSDPKREGHDRAAVRAVREPDAGRVAGAAPRGEAVRAVCVAD
jgi:hypothetical protein